MLSMLKRWLILLSFVNGTSSATCWALWSTNSTCVFKDKTLPAIMWEYLDDWSEKVDGSQVWNDLCSYGKRNTLILVKTSDNSFANKLFHKGVELSDRVSRRFFYLDAGIHLWCWVRSVLKLSAAHCSVHRWTPAVRPSKHQASTVCAFMMWNITLIWVTVASNISPRLLHNVWQHMAHNGVMRIGFLSPKMKSDVVCICWGKYILLFSM